MMLPQHKLDYFAGLVERQIGSQIPSHNYFQLQNRLEEIVVCMGINGLKELWQKAQTQLSDEIIDLLADVAIHNETHFFRDPSSLDAFQYHVVPKLLATEPSKLNIWCAGSSFGQEAYTLAILLNELRGSHSIPPFEVYATDKSQQAIERATKGEFSQIEVQRGLPTKLLVKYFSKASPLRWRIEPQIKESIHFAHLDLLKPHKAEGRFQVIFCKNVLNYQRMENKRIALSLFSRYLDPHGFLILGEGETLSGLTEAFNLITVGPATIYQLKSPTP